MCKNLYNENLEKNGYWEEKNYYNFNIGSKGCYNNGVKNGYWIHYHGNGVKYEDGIFNNGEKIGLWKNYYVDSGALKIKLYYV